MLISSSNIKVEGAFREDLFLIKSSLVSGPTLLQRLTADHKNVNEGACALQLMVDSDTSFEDLTGQIGF